MIMKTYNLIDYKGKYDIIMDKGMEDKFDFIVGEINHEEAIKQAEDRKYWSNHYGIPALITKNKELNKLYKS